MPIALIGYVVNKWNYVKKFEPDYEETLDIVMRVSIQSPPYRYIVRPRCLLSSLYGFRVTNRDSGLSKK